MRKKRFLMSLASLCFILVILGSAFIECSHHPSQKEAAKPYPVILDLESKKSFEFFWEEANSDKSSPGFGLIPDRYPGNPKLSSVASVGFGLTADAIGAERGWVSKKEAKDRVDKTLDTLLNNADQTHGFFYHFLNMDNAKRAGTSEVSIIDTAIAINGAITAGEYFQGDVKKKAEELYKRVDWPWFRDPSVNQFYMAYTPENGFAGHWDFYAEQLMLYFLAAGSPTHPVNKNMFYDFKRVEAVYNNGKPFIHSWFGSIFTYQYTFAWFDLRNKVDNQGINWWENSVAASKANLQFCIDNSNQFKTFGAESWGVTASDGPDGYDGAYGAIPSGLNNDQNKIDGTIAPAGAAGSIVFTSNASIQALENYYKNDSELWGKYGFKDAYNLDVSPAWYDSDVIGIDKGITLLMIENYRSEFVWKYFMKNKYVENGIKAVGIKSLKSK